MSSVRLLGDDLSLVFCVYSLKGFSSSEKYLKIVASLDSRETLEADAVENGSESQEVEINTELVWTMSRTTFQTLRSRKANIKAQVVAFSKNDDDSTMIIGSLVMDLREAVPIEQNDPEHSYAVHSQWKRLLNCPKNASIRVALALEPLEQEVIQDDLSLVVGQANQKEANLAENVQELNQKQGFFTPNLEEIVKNVKDSEEVGKNVQDVNQMQGFFTQNLEEMDKNVKDLQPILNQTQGFFTLGDSNVVQDDVLVYFNVFIAFGRNLDKAIPKDVVTSAGELFHFSYNLLGIEIRSETFADVKTMSGFAAEKATARIRTSPEKLRFFFEHMNPFPIHLCVHDKVLATTHVDLANVLIMDEEKLKDGQLIVHEGLARVVASVQQECSVDSSAATATSRQRLWSEGDLERPHVGVRFSIGIHQDKGLAEQEREEELTPVKDQPSPTATMMPNIHNVDGDHRLPEFDVSKIDGASVEINSATRVNAQFEKSIQTPHKFVLADPRASSSSNTDETANFNVDENDVTRFKFSMDLKQISSEQPINCVISYTYKSFCETEVSTQPPFKVDKPNVEIRRGYCEYGFSAKEASLKKPFGKYKMVLNVLHSNDKGVLENYGIAQVDLSKLFDAPKIVDTRTCQHHVTIFNNKESHGHPLGQILISYSLKYTKRELPSSSCVNKKKTVDQIALDLEQWKRKEKDKFKAQLEGLEKHHIKNTLTIEWEKREKERSAHLQAKLQEIMEVEKDLRKALADVKLDHEALQKRNLELDLKEKRLNEVQKNNKKSTTAGSSVDQLNQIKAECEKWKAKYEMAVKQVDGLKDQLVQATKTKESFKKAWENAEKELKNTREDKEKVIFQQLQQYRNENDDLKRQILMQQTSTSFKEPREEKQVQADVDNKSSSQEVMRLKQQREMFLKTKAYNENDTLIRLIDEKLQELQN